MRSPEAARERMLQEVIRSPRLRSGVQSPNTNTDESVNNQFANANRRALGFAEIIDVDAPADNSNANSDADAMSTRAQGTYNNRHQPRRNNETRERNANYFDDFQDALVDYTIRISGMP